MKHLFALLAAGGLAVCVSAGFGASAAYAESPTQQGWWTSTNPGSVDGLPTPPASPDLPANGLLIEGGPSSTTGSSNASPAAFGALIYEIPQGANVGDLTLAVAANSATTPTTILELCPLTDAAIPAEQGGPMSDAPAFTCNTNASASPSSSGHTYQFNVAPLVSDGQLAFAILPTSPLDRVVLAQPDATSLPITEPSTTAPSSNSVSATTTTGAGGTGVQQTSSTSIGSSPVAENPRPAPAVGDYPTPSTGAASPSLATVGNTATTAVPSPNTDTAAQFADASTGPPPAKPLAIGLLGGGVLLAGLIWTAVGRASARERGTVPRPVPRARL